MSCMMLIQKGLKTRGGIGAKKKRRKGNFNSKGPNWVHSFDGHDKMMRYQNSTFPLAVCGWIDTASRKVLWPRIWTTNTNPKLVGCWYPDHLMETRIISRFHSVFQLFPRLAAILEADQQRLAKHSGLAWQLSAMW